jgi:hypothetical protein
MLRDNAGQGVGPSRIIIGGSAANYSDLFLEGVLPAMSRRSPFKVTPTYVRPRWATSQAPLGRPS